MSKLRLYIENQEVELLQNIQFNITKQFVDLENPTTIINSWSKTIEIPFTEKNNKLFGGAFREDKQDVVSNKITIPDTAGIISDNPEDEINWNYSELALSCKGIQSYIVISASNIDATYNKSGKYTLNFTNTDDRLTILFYNSVYKSIGGCYFDLPASLNGMKLSLQFNVSFEEQSKVTLVSLSNNGDNIGTKFNSTDRFDFRIEKGSAVLMEGYGKINSINKKNGNGTYNITLYGQLGKILSDMKNITFDKSSDNHEYIIQAENYYSEVLDRNLVKDAWEMLINSTSFYKKGQTYYNPSNIIGFAPVTSFNELFDYSQEMTLNVAKYESESLVDKLNNSELFASNGIDANLFFPYEGKANSLEYGSFPTYTQVPFIFWNQLFQIFQEKAEKFTGYKFVLDNKWFNDGNSMWKELVFMLDPALKNRETDIIGTNKYRLSVNDFISTGANTTYANWYANYQKSWNMPISIMWSAEQYGWTKEDVLLGDRTNPTIFHCSNIQRAKSSGKTNDSFSMTIQYTVPGDDRLYASDELYQTNNTLRIDLVIDSANIGPMIYKSYVLVDSTHMDSAYYDSLIGRFGNDKSVELVESSFKYFTGRTFRNYVKIPLDDIALVNGMGDTQLYFRVSILDTAETNFNNFMYWKRSNGEKDKRLNVCNMNFGTQAGLSCDIELDITKTFGRSFSNITIADLWNNEFNIFDEIIKYCKANRILIYVDTVNKEIHFEDSKTYFDNIKIVNAENLIDTSKDFNIVPIIYDTKYIMMDYDSADLALDKEYKEKYGINYGAKRLITTYDFDIKEKTIFTLDKPSKTISHNYRVVSLLKNGWNRIYSTDLSTIDTAGDENKFQSVFGAWYLFNGRGDAYYPNTLYLQDDNIGNMVNEKYCYHTTDAFKTPIQYFTYLTTERPGDYSVHISNPMKVYDKYLEYRSGSDIFSKRWSKYVNELYDIRNKKVTCYMRLPYSLFSNLKFDTFFKIGTQLYFLNKIYDYNLSEEGLTKVELLTVQNIGAYYNATILEVNTNQVKLVKTSSKTVDIVCDSNWTASLTDTLGGLVDIDKISGSGSDTIKITSTNTNLNATTSLVVSADGISQTIDIILSDGQAAKLNLSTQSISHPADGKTYTDTITVDSNYDWTSSVSGSGVVISPTFATQGQTTVNITSNSTNTGQVIVEFDNKSVNKTLTVNFTEPPIEFNVTTNVRLSETVNPGASLRVNYSTASTTKWEFSFDRNSSQPSNEFFEWNPSNGTGGTSTWLKVNATPTGHGGEFIPYYVRLYRGNEVVEVKEYQIEIVKR